MADIELDAAALEHLLSRCRIKGAVFTAELEAPSPPDGKPVSVELQVSAGELRLELGTELASPGDGSFYVQEGTFGLRPVEIRSRGMQARPVIRLWMTPDHRPGAVAVLRQKDEADSSDSEQRQGEGPLIRVIVTGRYVDVEPEPGMTIGAIATKARWIAGCGSVPFDNWEIRSEDGTLLDPSAQPGKLRVLVVNLLAGIGA